MMQDLKAAQKVHKRCSSTVTVDLGTRADSTAACAGPDAFQVG
jgi:hypothetical protein